MQTRILDTYRATADGVEADHILRNCVHCGFCTATCPTYQVLGDELDSPRGRIYLIKQILEGQPVTRKTQLHLDRCLTCRSCETTCPSGVKYTRLLDIGRRLVEDRVGRTWPQQWLRTLLCQLLTQPVTASWLLRLNKIFKPLLPRSWRLHIRPARITAFSTTTSHPASVILLEGCVQPSMAPDINTASKYILDMAGYAVITLPALKCCGAISHHLSATQHALQTMKDNIDACWPHIEKGCTAIISNASGCGVMLQDYATLLAHDEAYAGKAKKFSALVKDISEMLNDRTVEKLRLPAHLKVSFHAPCTLQHGLRLKEPVEKLLARLGFDLCETSDQHLCCGSAGTYSLLQPKIATQLRNKKLVNLTRPQPDYIVTANIGCLHHLQAGTDIPVRHWVELVVKG